MLSCNLSGLWGKGALAGKLAGTFVSTGTQQGGQAELVQRILPLKG